MPCLRGVGAAGAKHRLGPFGEPSRDRGIEVVAAEMRVARGREHLEDLVFPRLAVGLRDEPQDRDVEGPAAEVVDRDGRGASSPLRTEPVGERRRGRLVHDPQDLESREASGVARRLALGIVEVGRHRDHRAADVAPEVRRGDLAKAAEIEGGDLLRRADRLAVGDAGEAARARDDGVGQPRRHVGDVGEASSHQPLHAEDRPLGVVSRRGSRGFAKDRRRAGLEPRDRRQQGTSGLVGKHARAGAIAYCDERVGGAEIDAEHEVGLVRGLRQGGRVLGRRIAERAADLVGHGGHDGRGRGFAVPPSSDSPALSRPRPREQADLSRVQGAMPGTLRGSAKTAAVPAAPVRHVLPSRPHLRESFGQSPPAPLGRRAPRSASCRRFPTRLRTASGNRINL